MAIISRISQISRPFLELWNAEQTFSNESTGRFQPMIREIWFWLVLGGVLGAPPPLLAKVTVTTYTHTQHAPIRRWFGQSARSFTPDHGPQVCSNLALGKVEWIKSSLEEYPTIRLLVYKALVVCNFNTLQYFLIGVSEAERHFVDSQLTIEWMWRIPTSWDLLSVVVRSSKKRGGGGVAAS